MIPGPRQHDAAHPPIQIVSDRRRLPRKIHLGPTIRGGTTVSATELKLKSSSSTAQQLMAFCDMFQNNEPSDNVANITFPGADQSALYTLSELGIDTDWTGFYPVKLTIARGTDTPSIVQLGAGALVLGDTVVEIEMMRTGAPDEAKPTTPVLQVKHVTIFCDGTIGIEPR